MKALQKVSKFLSDYTSVVVIAIAVVTFFVPTMMGWVNNALFVDPVSNKFTCQSIIIGVIMFSMGLTLTTEDFKILAQRPFDICIGAIAQYLIMPFLAFALTKALNLPDGIALGLILVGCCPGGVSSNIMSYLCGGDVAFSVGMTTVSTLLSPVMTPLMVSLLASGTHISIKGLPMFVSIIETVIFPVAVGFLLNYLSKKRRFVLKQDSLPQAVVLLLQSISQKTMLRQRAAVVTMLPHQKIPRKMILRVLMRTHLLQVPILPEQPHHRILPLLGQQPNLLPAETLLEQPEQLQVILPAALLVATLEAEVPLNK